MEIRTIWFNRKYFVICLAITYTGACKQDATAVDETENLGASDVAIVVSGDTPADGAATVVVSTTSDGESTQSFVSPASVSSVGDFSLSGPTGTTADSSPVFVWTASSGALTYDVSVSANSNCSSPLDSGTDLEVTSWAPAPLANGTYYACVSATNLTDSVAASNNGLSVS